MAARAVIGGLLLASAAGLGCPGPYPKPFGFGGPHDFLWDQVEQSRNRVALRGHVFKVCVTSKVAVEGAAVQLVSMDDDHVLASTTSDRDGRYEMATFHQLLNGKRCELRGAGIAKVIGNLNPDIVDFDLAQLCGTSATDAAALASYLANEECFRLYGDRPFAPDRWPAEQRGRRWFWGRVDPTGVGGYSAAISFADDGRDVDVRIFMIADAVDQ